MSQPVGSSNNAVANFDKPLASDETVAWTSSNASVASVPATDPSATPGATRSIVPVSANAPGTATIECKVNNPSGVSASGTATETVVAAPTRVASVTVTVP